MENKKKKGLAPSEQNKISGKKSNNQEPFNANRSSVKNGDGRRGELSAGVRRVKKVKPDGKSQRDYSTREAIYLQSELTEADRHREIEKKRKEERLKRQRLQTLAGLIAAAALAIILLFMTPIFNIREIRLNGNNTVPKEMITEKIGHLVGANIFSTSISGIEKKMEEIPQINSVEVKKNIFPPYIDVSIIECRPAAYLVSGNKTIVIDSDLVVIDDADVFDTDSLPSVSGISVSEYQVNSVIEADSQEKKDALYTMLKAFSDAGITDKITYVSLDDLSALKFNYDSRIEVSCGSQLQLSRKISMFAEALKTDTITEESMGSMDLSVPGRAIYDP